MKNYYAEGLDKIKKDPEYMQIKIKNLTSTTKWMNINPDSIEAVISFLVKQLRNYKDKSTPNQSEKSG